MTEAGSDGRDTGAAPLFGQITFVGIGLNTVPPISATSWRKVSCMCLLWLRS